MIYFDTGDLHSIVEVIYLEEEFDLSVSSNIHVNPKNPTYLIGKTIILNTPQYPKEKIDILKENRCDIISRVVIPGVDYIEISPYILRPCFDVLWNGQEIYVDDWDKFLYEKEVGIDPWFFYIDDYKLYFPKIIGGDIKELFLDEGGNLTWLGWLLQQVGENIRTDTVFIDLDLLKTKKMDLGKG